MRHRSVPWNQRQSPLSRTRGGAGRKEQPQIGDAPASQKAVLCARGTGPLHLRKGKASATVLGCRPLGAASRRD